LRQEQLKIEQIQMGVEQEVRGGLDDVALKTQAVKTADRVAQLARAQQENAEALFEAGAATSVDVGDARLAAFAAEVDAARARFDLETARLSLANTLGEFRPVTDSAAAPN
jgi:outer membrane protein TolC